MSGNGTDFIPPADEQAEEILDELRSNFDLAEDITAADIEPNVDPEKPVSVNLRRVRESLEDAL